MSYTWYFQTDDHTESDMDPAKQETLVDGSTCVLKKWFRRSGYENGQTVMAMWAGPACLVRCLGE